MILAARPRPAGLADQRQRRQHVGAVGRCRGPPFPQPLRLLRHVAELRSGWLLLHHVHYTTAVAEALRRSGARHRAPSSSACPVIIRPSLMPTPHVTWRRTATIRRSDARASSPREPTTPYELARRPNQARLRTGRLSSQSDPARESSAASPVSSFCAPFHSPLFKDMKTKPGNLQQPFSLLPSIQFGSKSLATTLQKNGRRFSSWWGAPVECL